MKRRMEFTVKEVLKQFKGSKIIRVVECTGPIPCYSIELDKCYIDIALIPTFPAFQIVVKDRDTIKARTEQLTK